MYVQASKSACYRSERECELSQSEFAARLHKVEVERQGLAEAVTVAERRCSEEKKRGDELQQQVKLHKANLESSKQELIDYKQKATRILQVGTRAHMQCRRHSMDAVTHPVCLISGAVFCPTVSTKDMGPFIFPPL